jgi:hypothetical protein
MNKKIQKKTVSNLLGVGIFLIPFLFSWFTLRQGYTTQARVLSFLWLIFNIIAVIISIRLEIDINLLEAVK